jgi:acyl carrier protein
VTIAEKVKDIIANEFDIDVKLVTDELPLEELGDSLDKTSLVMKFEEEFEIVIDNSVAATFITVKDIIEYIENICEPDH